MRIPVGTVEKNARRHSRAINNNIRLSHSRRPSDRDAAKDGTIAAHNAEKKEFDREPEERDLPSADPKPWNAGFPLTSVR